MIWTARLLVALATLVLWLMAPAVARDETAVIAAAERDDVDGVRRLLAGGTPIEARDAEGRTALMNATRANSVAAARLLIEAGADVNAKDQIADTPFLYAGAEGRTEILQAILASGKARLDDTNRYGGTALIPAAHHGHPDAVRLLIAAGVDLDHVNGLGWTALLEAVILGDGGPVHQDIVTQLVAAGARPIADRDGRTPLDHARERGFREIAARLENAGG